MQQTISDAMSDISGKAGEVMNSEQFKKLLPYLLTGGAGAAVGGMVTGKRDVRKGESRTSHLGRVLLNALLVGGGAAGATALLSRSKDNLLGSQEEMTQMLNKDNEGPMAATTRAVAFSPLTAMGAGALGLGATQGSKGFLGAGTHESEAALSALAKKVKLSPAELKLKTPEEIAALNLTGSSNKLRQAAGIGSGTGARGVVSNLARRGLSTFGQSWPRRMSRGALGLTAAAIPALLGAALTKDPNEPVV